MKIQLTFETFEEFDAFRAAAAAEAVAPGAADLPQEAPKAAPVPAPAEEAKAPAEEKPAAAPPKEEKPETDAPSLVEVRTALAELNKAVGRNRATEIIRELTGKDRLTDTAQKDWAAILAKAKEESHAD